MKIVIYANRIDPDEAEHNDGWMTCNFVSYFRVFQSYHDDGRMIMKDCAQWNPVNS